MACAWCMHGMVGTCLVYACLRKERRQQLQLWQERRATRLRPRCRLELCLEIARAP